MAHFAQLDANNVVTQVIVVNNSEVNDLPFPESEPLGVAFCQSLFGADTIWKQTSYNANFRGVYAGVDSMYLPDKDIFSVPRPAPSWSLNPDTLKWEPPVPYPSDGKTYIWNEAAQDWNEVTPPSGNM
jgi:hypothetical protein